MKIGFDISQTCESKSGTGFWADQLIRALAQIDKEHESTLLPWFYDYRPQTIDNATKITQANFSECLVREFSDSNNVMKDLDIVISNNFRYPNNISAKKVVTIYDVCFLDHPEYTTEANRLFCYRGTLDSVLWADKIVAISNYTKNRLLHFFPFVDESKIEVVYCGNRENLLKEKDDESRLMKFGLSKEQFFLSVGTIEPRKNYATLLKAYKISQENTVKYRKLCIAGGYGWMQEHFKQDIADMGLENDVVVTGYVSESDLANLYRYCYTFIYPTWYEGFGLPVLEAMNFGKPIIASKVTSIPEIVGDTAMLCDPGDFKQIGELMCRVHSEEMEIDSLHERYEKRCALFSWDKSAGKVLSILKQI